VQLAVDHQHRARLGGDPDVGRGLPFVAGNDLGAAILTDLEHAIGHQMEIAAALAGVDGVDLTALDDRQPNGTAILIIHASVHGEGYLAVPLSEFQLEIGQLADRKLIPCRSNQLYPSFASVADGEATPLEHLRLAGRDWRRLRTIRRFAAASGQQEYQDQASAHRARLARSGGGVDAELAEFPVKCRAANSETAGDFGHAATIMADGEADDIGFDFLETAQVAVLAIESDLRRTRHRRIGR
jgi:hypothetical protein